ncbi:EscU/YscU/HrcU family type III secretion system export apparatus switch protein [Tropicimonas sp. S265A]|uniref:EscU/YscU/HrcU family type III secretion system export apparatus switch protein n=1 Tax=Tropicimonas sp. S265A TaxID=3415134 RepID=UPI003C798E46
MSESDSGEKEFEASEKRLKSAKEKGDVVRSSELSSAFGIILTVMVVTLFSLVAYPEFEVRLSYYWSGDAWIQSNAGLDALILQHLGIISSILPLFLLILIVSGVSSVGVPLVMRDFVFSSQRIMPKLSNISLVSGIKNKFGPKGLFEFFKSALKLSILFIIGFFLLKGEFNELYNLLDQSLSEGWRFSLELLILFCVTCSGLALGVGVIDYLVQRAFHLKKLRMSRKEAQDEAKENEGDPLLRSKRRQRAEERARQGGLTNVPDADVVVVNPTHFAVALKWDRDGGSVPIVVAKGVDEIALRIREIAYENGVPVRRDPLTARSLHKLCEIGDKIRPEHFRAVAAAIRFSDALKKRKLG